MRTNNCNKVVAIEVFKPKDFEQNVFKKKTNESLWLKVAEHENSFTK